jgi:hypothetical protein
MVGVEPSTHIVRARRRSSSLGLWVTWLALLT